MRARRSGTLEDDDPRPPLGLQARQEVVQLVGLGTGTGDTSELFWAVRRLFEAMARRRPLIVVFDEGTKAQFAVIRANRVEPIGPLVDEWGVPQAKPQEEGETLEALLGRLARLLQAEAGALT